MSELRLAETRAAALEAENHRLRQRGAGLGVENRRLRERLTSPIARMLAREIGRHSDCRWRFLTDERIPPPNNVGERLIRPSVIVRNLGQGNDNDQGAVFTSRILTTVMTLRLQDRNAFDFLVEAGSKARSRYGGSYNALSLQACRTHGAAVHRSCCVLGDAQDHAG